MGLGGQVGGVGGDDEAAQGPGRPGAVGVEEARDGVSGRFDREDVEAGAGEVVGDQGGLEGVEVDGGAAGGADENGVLGQEGELGGADHADRFGGVGGVEAEDVGLAEEVFQGEGAGDAEGEVGAVGAVGVEEHDLEAEGLGAQGDGGADAAEADNAERLGAERRRSGKRVADQEAGGSARWAS